jgi:hypothetical protein
LNEIGSEGFNIRAYTNPKTTGSVVFNLKDITNPETSDYIHIENVEPYALFGNVGEDFFGRKPELGTYLLSATPYSEPNGQGTMGTSLEISFTILEPYEFESRIVKVTLINAKTNEELYEITDGTIIDLQEIGTDEINFRAYTDPQIVGSVHFHLIGTSNFSNNEIVEPYALFGNKGDDYNGWQAIPGEYELLVIPHSKPEIETGDNTIQFNFFFSIIIGQSTENLRTLNAFPNPGFNLLHIPVENPETKNLQVQIFDLKGHLVKTENTSQIQAGTFSIDVSELKSQPYIIKTVSGKEVKRFRWVKE